MRATATPDVQVNEATIIEFFDARARRAADATRPAVTMLQDANPALALQRSEVEVRALRALIARLPVQRPRTLDVGCGTGRLCFALRDVLGDYLGVDGAASLIAAARVGVEPPSAARFEVHNLATKGLAALHGEAPPPELVLMSGILIYLNDGSVRQLLAELAQITRGPCTLVLREPVGVQARLTLKDHWSDELQAPYNAVYRTGDELRQMLVEAFGARLARFDQRWLYEDAALNNRAETRQALMEVTLS